MKNFVLSRTILVLTLCLSPNFIFADAPEAQSTDRFPMRSIDRPAVMPTGVFNIDTTAKLTGLKTVGLDIDSQFGIVNKLEGQFGYDGVKFNTTNKKNEHKAFLAEHVFRLGLKYNYLGISHVSFSASASLPIHVFDGEIIQDVTLGLPVTFYNHMMAGGILGDVFNLRMRDKIEMTFKFPFWFGLQVTDNLWAQVKSSFGTIAMENKTNQAKWEAYGFWKKLPATLSATYAITHHFDLGASFGFDDVFKAKDTITFGITFSAHGGRIFG